MQNLANFKDNTKSDSEILRERIQFLIVKSRINASTLSKDTNIPSATLNRLLNGSMEDPKLSVLKTLANYFSVSITQLIGDEPLDAFQGSVHGSFSEVPIISWHDAVKSCSLVKDLNKTNYEKWILVEKLSSENNFGLVSKRYMESKFPTGSVLIVDQNAEIVNYDLVLVHYKNAFEAVIEEIYFEGSNIRYKSINGELINDNSEKMIIGVIVNTIISYNKDRTN